MIIRLIMFATSAIMAAAVLFISGVIAFVERSRAIEVGVRGAGWETSFLAVWPGLILTLVLAMGAWAFVSGGAGWIVKGASVLVGGFLLAYAIWIWTLPPFDGGAFGFAALGLLCAAPLALPGPRKS